MLAPTFSTTSLSGQKPRRQSSEWAQRSMWRRHRGRKGTKRVMSFCSMMLEWKKPPGESEREQHFSLLHRERRLSRISNLVAD